ncbi:MAG: glycosyltransferase family 9 protein [Candidatus Latescibacteria bacterium]|nr:glycosyltransferase family 9 protein [Candidatus Latescibacterota bacterium]
MKAISDFIKNKIKRVRHGSLLTHGNVAPVNMTKVLLHPRSILIIPYRRMGTVLLATRVFKAFRDHFKSSRITVAVHDAWSVLIQRDPTVDEVVTYGDFIERPTSKEFRKFGKELAERQFDLAFFLSYHMDEEMAYLTGLTNADLRVSFSRGSELDFFNVEIVPSPEPRYEVERYLEMMRTLGIDGKARDYTMTISDSIREKARMRFLPAGPLSQAGRMVGFDLTREISGGPISRKNAEHVIKTLINGLNATVVVFMEPGKKSLAAELKEVFGKSIILVEDKPVSILAGSMSFCRFIVAHNTDLFQLAVSVKLPVIGVFTETEMTQWSPGENESIVHLIRTDNSWPSSGAIMNAAKKIVAKTKK